MVEEARQQGRGVGGMIRRLAFWLAWSLAALSVASFITSIPLYFLARPAQEAPISWNTLGNLLVFVPFLAFPLVGALIASRRPQNPIGWICLVAGLFWTLIALDDQYTAYALATTGVVPLPAAVALNQWAWVPPVGLLSIYLILLFPDGKLPSRRWRPLAWFSGRC